MDIAQQHDRAKVRKPVIAELVHGHWVSHWVRVSLLYLLVQLTA
jgi:hypothetical protein